jgi:hypothetical protein
MTDSLRWFSVDKHALPGVIAEGVLPDKVMIPEMPSPSLGSPQDNPAVGCVRRDHELKPVVIVVDKGAARDTLAWLATYSPASFPIAQSLRALTTADFISASALASTSAKERRYWPSIVFGELLGQGEHGTTIDSVALSRANACFSFAQARIAELYEHKSTFVDLCCDRFRVLENEKVFVRRTIPLGELLPIWSWARISPPEDSIEKEVLRVIEFAVDSGNTTARHFGTTRLDATGLDAPALATGPMEDRVRAFQVLARHLENMHRRQSSMNAMLLGAAAICVGNGTSHISLLNDVSAIAPAAVAWFGLFAGLMGPKCWEPSWNRAVNSIDRLIRGRFRIDDPPTFDLSWAEYDFAREVARPAEFLKQFPKLYPRLLTIEVVPGAVCQLRMCDESLSTRATTRSVEDKVVVPRAVATALEADFAAGLLEIERALSRCQELLKILKARGAVQGSLFEDTSEKIKKKYPKRYGRKENWGREDNEG